MFLALEIIFMVLQLVLIAICLRALKKIKQKTMYSYRIISLIGSIIFFTACFVSHLISILTWPSEIEFELYHLMGMVIGTFTSFATIVTFFILPPLCLFLIVSNLVLLKKEGKSLPNLLGILLCFALVIGSSVLFFSHDLLSQIMNVYSYGGYCFSLWVEDLFSITLSYFECLLFATIFVACKSRRHISKPDKDYMIILGCYVRDDGEPGGLLKGRINRALDFMKLQKKETRKEFILVPSGGKGSD